MRTLKGRRLAGRVVLITGAAGGIGSAIARRMALEGARIVCADLDEGFVTALATELGGGSVGHHLDVSDEASVASLFSKVNDWDGLDVVCNVAGIAGPQVSAEHTSTRDWDRTFAVNTRGTFLVTRHAIPHLRRTSGNIINIASALAMIGWRSESAYGPSKAAVVQFTKSAALDLAPEIRVNCILPGAVMTPMITSVLADSRDPDAALRQYGSIHPYGGALLPPDAIADAAVFLASDDAGFITGVALPIDAGMLASGRNTATNRMDDEGNRP